MAQITPPSVSGESLLFTSIGTHMNHLQAKDPAARSTICPINLLYLRRGASKHSFRCGSMSMKQSNHTKRLKS